MLILFVEYFKEIQLPLHEQVPFPHEKFLHGKIFYHVT